jgi:hypothetical protein
MAAVRQVRNERRALFRARALRSHQSRAQLRVGSSMDKRAVLGRDVRGTHVENESFRAELPEENGATAAGSFIRLPTAALIFGIVFVILTALWELEINQEKPGRHTPSQPEQRAPEQNHLERVLVHMPAAATADAGQEGTNGTIH